MGKTLKDKLNKMSFPMQGETFKRETTNGYYNPTSLQAAIMQKKNATATATRERLATKGVKVSQVSTQASEPEQSAAFKNGYRNR
jgi:hypothetical protein